MPSPKSASETENAPLIRSSTHNPRLFSTHKPKAAPKRQKMTAALEDTTTYVEQAENIDLETVVNTDPFVADTTGKAAKTEETSLLQSLCKPFCCLKLGK